MKLNKINFLTKFNLRVIDLLGILLVVGAVFTVAFFFLRKGVTVDVVVRASERDGVYTPWNNEVALWYASSLQVGMAQYDSFGKKTIEVIDKKIYPTGQDYRVVDLTLRVRAVYNKRTKQHLYGGDPILIGATQKFQLGPYVIRGLVRDINNTARYQTKTYIVKGYLSPLQNNVSVYGWGGSFSGTPNTTGVPSYLADSIAEGESVRDSNGHIVATVISVETRPAVFVLANTLPYQIVDKRNSEVYIELQLEGEIIGDKPLYLGIQPLLINSTTVLHLDKKSLVVSITDVKELPDSGK